MNTIAAIETVYRGFRFRSRLEARWAVFFDATCKAIDEAKGNEPGYWPSDLRIRELPVLEAARA